MFANPPEKAVSDPFNSRVQIGEKEAQSRIFFAKSGDARVDLEGGTVVHDASGSASGSKKCSFRAYKSASRGYTFEILINNKPAAEIYYLRRPGALRASTDDSQAGKHRYILTQTISPGPSPYAFTPEVEQKLSLVTDEADEIEEVFYEEKFRYLTKNFTELKKPKKYHCAFRFRSDEPENAKTAEIAIGVEKKLPRQAK